MLATVNIRSDVPVYMQIENEIQFAIASGTLNAGDQLPTLHELAKRLEINSNTVAKSYRDLEVMGLIYSLRGRGVFIRKGITANCQQRCLTRAVERLHELTQEAKAAGMKKGDLAETINKSFASKGSPYGNVPRAVLATTKA